MPLSLPRCWASWLTCNLHSLIVWVQEMSLFCNLSVQKVPLFWNLSIFYLVVRMIIFSSLCLLSWNWRPFTQIETCRKQHSFRYMCQNYWFPLFPGEETHANWCVRPCSCFEKHICTDLCLPETSSCSACLLSPIAFPFWKKLWKIRMKVELCFNQDLYIPMWLMLARRIVMDGMWSRQKPI